MTEQTTIHPIPNDAYSEYMILAETGIVVLTTLLLGFLVSVLAYMMMVA